MSNKKDDDFWTILALYWLMQDGEEEKPVDTNGCFPMLLFAVFMIGGLSENHYWKVASVAVFAYFLWNNFRRFSKFLIKGVFCSFFSALVGCFLQPILGSRFLNINTNFDLVVYSVFFLFCFMVVCPWLTNKVKEILGKR